MDNVSDENIDQATIEAVGLRLTDKHLNAETAANARVFEYPQLEGVYIMESDLYGNKMPKDTCFLAFNGQHGMIGKHLKVETLRHSTVNDIKQMVEENSGG